MLNICLHYLQKLNTALRKQKVRLTLSPWQTIWFSAQGIWRTFSSSLKFNSLMRIDLSIEPSVLQIFLESDTNLQTQFFCLFFHFRKIALFSTAFCFICWLPISGMPIILILHCLCLLYLLASQYLISWLFHLGSLRLLSLYSFSNLISMASVLSLGISNFIY